MTTPDQTAALAAAPGPKGGLRPITRRVMNLAHFMRQTPAATPDEIAFVHGDAVLTWAALDRRIDGPATALAARGVGKGDRVLVQSRNCHQMFETMFACFRLGAVYVPTNSRQTPAEVAYSGPGQRRRHPGLPLRLPRPRRGRAEPVPHAPRSPSAPPTSAKTWTPPSPPVDGPMAPTADVEHDDPCWFFFTSGTTGRPKASVLTHGQMAFVVTNHLADLMPGTTHQDASLVARSAVPWCRRASTGSGRPRREDRAADQRALRCRGSLVAGRANGASPTCSPSRPS